MSYGDRMPQFSQDEDSHNDGYPRQAYQPPNFPTRQAYQPPNFPHPPTNSLANPPYPAVQQCQKPPEKKWWPFGGKRKKRTKRKQKRSRRYKK